MYHNVVFDLLLYKRGKDGERLGKNFSLGMPSSSMIYVKGGGDMQH